jgi:hypothetical protein
MRGAIPSLLQYVFMSCCLFKHRDNLTFTFFSVTDLGNLLFPVLSTRSDPVSGWIDNLYGPTGAVVAVGLGMIRTMHIKEKFVGDMIPCDMAVSALVASAWHAEERRR